MRRLTLIHFVCTHCAREWWLDAAQRNTYLLANVGGSVDCPYCSTRTKIAYSIDSGEISELRV